MSICEWQCCVNYRLQLSRIEATDDCLLRDITDLGRFAGGKDRFHRFQPLLEWGPAPEKTASIAGLTVPWPRNSGKTNFLSIASILPSLSWEPIVSILQYRSIPTFPSTLPCQLQGAGHKRLMYIYGKYIIHLYF